MDAEMMVGMDASPIPRAVSATTEANHVVVVTKNDGSTLRADLTGWIATGGPVLRRLHDPVTFSRVDVVDFGTALEWDGDENLALDMAYLEMLAEQQSSFTSADLLAWQQKRGLSNSEAADLLDVHVNTWSNYRRGAKVPRAIAVAVRAMDRNPVIFAAHYHPSNGDGR